MELKEFGPLVIIHGGAWAIPDDLVQRSLEGVRDGATLALKLLEEGKTCLEAVEAAITVLEDNDAFDAGKGSVLTARGEVEMDAMIMAGEDLRCGAVACVNNVKNPIKLARTIMEETNHTMMVGTGALEFAKNKGLEIVSTRDLLTPEAIKTLEDFNNYSVAVDSLFNSNESCGTDQNSHDTVGCVALDKYGNLAAATSTGGITNKYPGRVGDSPLIGSGGFADNASAAVSCTGHGESITKTCLAKSISDRCSRGLHAQKSIEVNLHYMKERVGGAGGAICISKDGSYGLAFSTSRMAWAIGTPSGIRTGIDPDDTLAD